ncbi:ZN593-like protein, partial [Mya arenaria]
MGRVARKKQHKGDKPLKEKYRTKRKTKDIDEIHEDMIPAKSQKLLNQEVDYDKPGAAQIKALQVEPYTQAEADRAAGMGSYVAPKPIHV